MDTHVPDLYSYGRTMHFHFKSDTFMTGNQKSIRWQVRTQLQPILHLSQLNKELKVSKVIIQHKARWLNSHYIIYGGAFTGREAGREEGMEKRKEVIEVIHTRLIPKKCI